jgi:hypothetical protein
MATQEEYHAMSESDKKKEDWMNAKWRPMMGWMFMLVCTMDFVMFPILWSLVQVIGGGRVETQWQPITLQGAGLFHMAMGAIIGISAFGRTQEKLAGANNGGAVGTTYVPPAPVANSGFSSPAPAASSGFGNAAPAQSSGFGGAVSAGFGGKPAPVQPAFPVI